MASIKIDTRDFQKWFLKNREYSKRGLADDLNQSAYSILINAPRLTPRAKASSITAVMGTKSNPTASAYAIVQSRRNAQGKDRLKGEALKQDVAKEISRRKSSIAFLGSGWLAALAKYARAIRKPVGANAERAEKKRKSDQSEIGGGTPAIATIRPIASFWNDAFSLITTNNPSPAVLEALKGAMAKEVDRMRLRIAKKLEQMNR
jgi:hypothetical protein